jgi:hypothetical protein
MITDYNKLKNNYEAMRLLAKEANIAIISATQVRKRDYDICCEVITPLNSTSIPNISDELKIISKELK